MRVKRRRQEFLEEDVTPPESPERSSFVGAAHSTGFGATEEEESSDQRAASQVQRENHFDITSNTKAQIATFTAVLSTLPLFPEGLDLSQARQRWKMFIRQFEDVCELRPDLDDKQKALLLKVKGGVTLQSIVRQLGDSTAKSGYTAIKDGINSYYDKHSVVQVDIEKFRAIKQLENETFAAFMSRLRNQAELCDFKDEAQVSEEIAQMVIIGARDRKYIMQKLGDAGKMKLEELEITGMRLEIANDYETGRKPSSSFSTAHMQEVNAIEKSSQPLKSGGNKADRHEHASRQDRSRSRDRGSRRQRSGERYRRRSRSRENRRRSRSDERSRQQRGGYSGRRDFPKKKRSGPCTQCGEFCENGRCAARGATCSHCGMTGHLLETCWRRDKRPQKREANQVGSEKTHSKSEHYCSVGGTKLLMKIDSGSDINCITEKQNEAIRRDELIGITQTFEPSSKRRKVITAYGSSDPLTVVRTFAAVIQGEDKRKPSAVADFSVIKDARRALLGEDTATQLKLLHTGREVAVIDSLRTKPVTSSTREFPFVPGKLIKFEIDESVVPKKRLHYRVPASLETQVNDRLLEMEQQGIIEKAEGAPEWVAPMEVVMKGANDFRIVIDMREANKAIKRQPFPIPTIEQYRVKLKNAQFMSKLDLKNAFFHLKLHKESRKYTTFMTSRGPMQYCRLMFGVNTAPEAFQRTMTEILAGCEGTVNYLDDILVFGDTQKTHDERLKEVLKRLKENNLTLNTAKCALNTTSAAFLGYRIEKGTIKPAEDKLETLSTYRAPKNRAELQTFLGLITYIGPFIKNLAAKSEPLRRLLKKNAQWSWGEDQEKSFQELKTDVATNVEAQTFFDPSCQSTKLYTDASPHGIGAVLTQQKTSEPAKIVAIISKTLTDVEKRYPQVQKEALAVVWSVERLHYYLLGHDFEIWSDCQALSFIFNGKYRDGKRAISRAEGWALRLSHYNFKLVHVEGMKNIADPPSRLVTEENTTQEESLSECDLGEPIKLQVDSLELEVGPIQIISMQMVRDATKSDKQLLKVKEALRENTWEKGLEAFQSYQDEIWETTCGVFMKGARVIIPEALREKAIEVTHRGHAGATTMKRTLRDRVWWPKLGADVDVAYGKCLACATMQRENPPEPMIRTKLPNKPFEFVAIDFFSAGNMPEKVLVVTDYYSRFLTAKLLKKTDAYSTQQALTEIFTAYDWPERIKNDNGPPFNSTEYAEWCGKYGIVPTHTTPLWPRENGQVEENNKGIKRALTAAVVQKRPLKEALNEYIAAYNVRMHATTGKTPHSLLFGREAKGPLPKYDAEQYTAEDDDARDRDALEKLKAKVAGDRRRKAIESPLCVGDKVMLRTSSKSKLIPTFGPTPFKITEKQGSRVMVEDEAGINYSRNVALCKKFPEESPGKEICKMPVQETGKLPSPVAEEESRPRRVTLRPARFVDYKVGNLDCTQNE